MRKNPNVLKINAQQNAQEHDIKFKIAADTRMARHRHTKKHHKGRRHHKSRRYHKTRGGGWSEDLTRSVGVGYNVHQQYEGPGKDCAGVPVRPGTLPYVLHGGLPGLSGGKRRSRNRSRSRKCGWGGGTQLGVAMYQDQSTVDGSLTDKPASFPNPTGSGGSVGAPGVPVHGGKRSKQRSKRSKRSRKSKGGRYGFFPGMGPLNPSNGVGVSPAPFAQLGCDRGNPNPLNPNPGNIQMLSTSPFYAARGGGDLSGAPVSGMGSGYSAANFPPVTVGAADMMKYNAPTAGYGHAFQQFPPGSAVGGLMLNTPYDARTFNQACIKTGGGKRRSRRGGNSVADMAGSWSKLTEAGITGRSDFDGSHKMLPMKFGGKRRTYRKRHHKRHGRK